MKVFPDYYNILGVSPVANSDDIRKAYRNLAKQHHPDVNKVPGGEKLFADIADAYRVLSDPEARKSYDDLRLQELEIQENLRATSGAEVDEEAVFPASDLETYQGIFGQTGVDGHLFSHRMYSPREHSSPSPRITGTLYRREDSTSTHGLFQSLAYSFWGKTLLRIIFLLLIAIVVMVSVLTVASSYRRSQARRISEDEGRFRVVDNRIYGPNGEPFIVKGVTTVYGTFAGGDEKGYGALNYKNAQHDFDVQKSLGINTVRIFVQATDYDAQHEASLHTVISWARQRGFVVELTNSNSPEAASLPWLSYLARTYKNDPYIWIEPMNEPNCGANGNQAECFNWPFWQTEESTYIHTIRSAGMVSPIIIGGISWSWDLSQINQYPLDDKNLIYGVDRYGNNQVTFGASEQANCNLLWANLSSSRAILVDEVGAWNGPTQQNSVRWLQGFLDFAVTWVNYRGGAGVSAFVWHWSDQNSMTKANGQLTSWGNLFYAHYLRQVVVR